jgi:Flp pilus assembly pilin Flp
MKFSSHNMDVLHERLMAFLRHDQGMTITEYAVAPGLIAATLTVTFSVLGTTIDAIIVTVIAFM